MSAGRAPDVRLNQIRDLIAVSEAGSLRAAAQRIGISQPAMSKSLSELEREFQAQLLTRTSRGVALTAAGRAFVARTRVVQGELRKVREDLAALHGGAEGDGGLRHWPGAGPTTPDARRDGPFPDIASSGAGANPGRHAQCAPADGAR